MARLPFINSDSEDCDPVARQILLRASAVAGRMEDRNIFRVMANHPRALEAFVNFSPVQNCLVTPAEHELAYLTASVVNNCHY